MSITPVSNVSPLYRSHQMQNQGAANQRPKTTQTPADTVQLSPAALAHLKGADADGDGDGH